MKKERNYSVLDFIRNHRYFFTISAVVIGLLVLTAKIQLDDNKCLANSEIVRKFTLGAHQETRTKAVPVYGATTSGNAGTGWTYTEQQVNVPAGGYFTLKACGRLYKVIVPSQDYKENKVGDIYECRGAYGCEQK